MPGRTSQGWAFSLRDSVFDDDSDDDDDAPQSALTVEEQLHQDLDLASREDHAQFKPNPWTIAKVNAATRIDSNIGRKPAAAPAPEPTKPAAAPAPKRGTLNFPVLKRPNPPQKPKDVSLPHATTLLPEVSQLSVSAAHPPVSSDMQFPPHDAQADARPSVPRNHFPPKIPSSLASNIQAIASSQTAPARQQRHQTDSIAPPRPHPVALVTKAHADTAPKPIDTFTSCGAHVQREPPPVPTPRTEPAASPRHDLRASRGPDWHEDSQAPFSVHVFSSLPPSNAAAPASTTEPARALAPPRTLPFTRPAFSDPPPVPVEPSSLHMAAPVQHKPYRSSPVPMPAAPLHRQESTKLVRERSSQQPPPPGRPFTPRIDRESLEPVTTASSTAPRRPFVSPLIALPASATSAVSVPRRSASPSNPDRTLRRSQPPAFDPAKLPAKRQRLDLAPSPFVPQPAAVRRRGVDLLPPPSSSSRAPPVRHLSPVLKGPPSAYRNASFDDGSDWSTLPARKTTQQKQKVKTTAKFILPLAKLTALPPAPATSVAYAPPPPPAKKRAVQDGGGGPMWKMTRGTANDVKMEMERMKELEAAADLRPAGGDPAIGSDDDLSCGEPTLAGSDASANVHAHSTDGPACVVSPKHGDAVPMEIDVQLDGIAMQYPVLRQQLAKQKRAFLDLHETLGLDSCGVVWTAGCDEMQIPTFHAPDVAV